MGESATARPSPKIWALSTPPPPGDTHIPTHLRTPPNTSEDLGRPPKASEHLRTPPTVGYLCLPIMACLRASVSSSCVSRAPSPWAPAPTNGHPGHRPAPIPVPRPLPQGCIRREGTSEAVRSAVGGGCQSGWWRLLSVTNAIDAGTWRQGDSGWA